MAAESYRCLTGERDLGLAIAALSRQCRHMRKVAARTGPPPLRDFPANFEGLAKIVVGQQLSAASAAAIWRRVAAAIRPFKAEAVLGHSDDVLKGLGLSNGKIRTLRAVARAVADKEVRFAQINRMPDAAIHETLTQLHGVGPWTADIYLLFALRRADAFPPGDLALQIAAQRLFELTEKPTAAELLALAERWRPWRGAAARLLWADYALARSGNAMAGGASGDTTPTRKVRTRA